MVSAGIGDPITGKGAHVFVIDDPHKNAEEARSPNLQRVAFDGYRLGYDHASELDPRACSCSRAVGTRTLAGQALRDAEANGQEWTVLRLPALACRSPLATKRVRSGRCAPTGPKPTRTS